MHAVIRKSTRVVQTDNWISMAPFKAGPRYGAAGTRLPFDSGFFHVRVAPRSTLRRRIRASMMIFANVCRVHTHDFSRDF